MPIESYTKYPSLRPTVLAKDVLKNVYRPSGLRELPQSSAVAADEEARETDRAA